MVTLHGCAHYGSFKTGLKTWEHRTINSNNKVNITCLFKNEYV